MTGLKLNSSKMRDGLDYRRAAPLNRLFEDFKQIWLGILFRHSTQLEKLAISAPEEGQARWVGGELQIRKADGRWYVVDAAARADYDLTGTVTNTLSSAAESGVLVTITGTGQTATTNGSGAYSIPNVPKGAAVALTGAKSGYNGYSSTVNLASGDATKNFTIARRTISGTITSSLDSSPVAGVDVFITSISRSTTTDGSGNYALIDVPDGSYTLEATKTGYVSYSDSVTVTANVTKNFTVDPVTQTVSGTVTSSSTGANVEGVSVTIDGRPAVTTNSSGAYSRNTVPDGTHSVDGVKTGYFSDYSSTVTVSGAPATKNFVMTALEKAIQSGTGFGGNGTTGFTYGFKFTVTKTLKVKKIGFYNFDGTSRDYRLKLWDGGGSALVTEDFNSSSSGWTYHTLASPVTISPGDYYLSSYCLGGTTQAPHGAGTMDHEAIGPTIVDLYGLGDSVPWNALGSPARGVNILVEL